MNLYFLLDCICFSNNNNKNKTGRIKCIISTDVEIESTQSINIFACSVFMSKIKINSQIHFSIRNVNFDLQYNILPHSKLVAIDIF